MKSFRRALIEYFAIILYVISGLLIIIGGALVLNRTGAAAQLTTDRSERIAQAIEANTRATQDLVRAVRDLGSRCR